MTINPALSSWRQQTPILDISVDEVVPWAMPLVLRVERGAVISHEEALAASAIAVAKIMNDVRSEPGAIWHQDLENWMQGRIRKVARRARASKWEAVVNSMDGLIIQHQNAEIFIAPPHLVSHVPDVLSRLQVTGLELPSLPMVSKRSHLPVLRISMNPDLAMTTGKAMAQVGHASQLALLRLPEPLVALWSADFAIEVTLEAKHFYSAPRDAVEVEDAGFTEIPAGSLTCKAWLI